MVKVTRPTNAEAESVSYLLNGNAYELQTLIGRKLDLWSMHYRLPWPAIKGL